MLATEIKQYFGHALAHVVITLRPEDSEVSDSYLIQVFMKVALQFVALAGLGGRCQGIGSQTKLEKAARLCIA